MKLAEMVIGRNSHSHDFAELCENYYENYYDLVEKKIHKVFSNRTYVDKEDIMNEIIYDSVEQHQKIVKTSKDVSKLSEDYVVRKSIDRGIFRFITKDSVNSNTPHFGFGSNRNNTWDKITANVVVLDDPISPKYPDKLWRDSIPDNDLENPLDKLIYEEYTDILVSLVEDFATSDEFSSLRHNRKDIPDLMKITRMLLAEATSKDIKLELGVSDACIHRTKKNILLPLALIVIDDSLWYRKYWNCLSKKAKNIIYSKKGVAF